MKKLLLVFVALVLTTWAMGQSMSNYAFSYGTSGSLYDMTGATTLVPVSDDDTPYGPANIGFTFYFMGVPYTQFSASPDGFMKLGSVVAASEYTNSLTATTNIPKLAPYWDDMATGTNGYVKYRNDGVSPNKKLIVEWYVTVPRNTAGPATVVFQAVLSETTGVIDFIYGANAATTMTYSVGMNSSATQYASVTVSTNTCSYSAANNSNAAAIAAGLQYTFTPPATAPADPTWQATPFTAITASGMTLNWNDNATNETGYLIYRSLDGTNYTYITTTAANATSYAATGLLPGTTYYWMVAAVNEGQVSGFITNSQATNPPGNCVAVASGLWSVGSTWNTGVAPTATDNATIPDTYTVTLDASTNTCYNLTVDAGGALTVATGTTYKLTVNKDAVNNGTIDLYISTTVYGELSFAGAYNASLTGTGAVTDLALLSCLKGSGTITLSSPVLEIAPTNLTIRGGIATGFLQTGTFNGIVKISGSYTVSNNVFLTTSYSIPSTGGLWLNNSNFTVLGQNASPTLTGLLRISNGTYNIGTSNGNSMGWSTGAIIRIEGGALNATGRFGVSSSGNTINYSQTAGTVTVATMQNASSTLASFDLGTSATSVYNLTGGTITIQTANTTTGKFDFRGAGTGITPPIANYGGTILYLGNASTPAAVQTWGLAGHVPAGMVMRTTTLDNLATAGSVYYYDNLTIPATTTLQLSNGSTSGYGFWVKGNVVNNGAITIGTGTSGSRFDFSNALWGESVAQTYSGSGTFGTSAAPILSVGFNNNVGVTLSGGTLYSLRNNLFIGPVTNSANITLGNGTSGAAVIQRGVALTSVAGAYDTYPVLNLGATGTLSLVYSSSSGEIVTSYEIPNAKAARTVNNLTILNANGVKLDGNLTVGTTAAAGLLTLTTGVLKTDGYTLYLPYTGASISGGSATSYVDGKMVRSFATRTASGSYTTSTMFPIGKGTSYMPIYVDPTCTGAVDISCEAFLTNSGTMGAGVTAMSQPRWEALITTGSANFTSAYIRAGENSIVTGNQFLQAPSAAGVYIGVPVTSVFATGTPPTLTTGSPITSAFYQGYFAYGTLTPCTAPTTAPTAWSATYLTSTGFNGSWTAAAAPGASHYLVVRYASGGTVTPPVDYTNYTVGATLGAGTVRYSGTATFFVESGLTAGTTYDYYVYAYNNSGCYGPVYYTTALTGIVSTCATAVGAPGTPTASNIQANQFTASWTASSTTGVSYILDVATDASFTTFVAGYNGLDVGVGTLTYNVTLLTANTPYYVRVRAFDNTTLCYSVVTSTLATRTACDPLTTFPYTESFSGTFPACWAYGEGASGASYHWAPTTTDATHGVIGPYAGTHFMYLYVYLASTTYNPYYLITPDFTLPATTKVLKYYYWLGASGYTTTPVPLAVEASVDYGTSWVKLYDHTTANSVFSTTSALTGWTPNSITLTGYENTTVRFRFTSNSNYGSGYCDQGIDEFMIDDPPPCPQPTALNVPAKTATTATLDWTNGGTEVLWNVKYGAPGFNPATEGTLITGINAHPYLLNPAPSGLTPSTSYDWYVAADCGDTKAVSVWSGPGTFKTDCDALATPNCQPFTNTTIPDCWAMSGPQAWLFTTTWPYYGASGVADHTTGGGTQFAGVDGSGTAGLTGITLLTPFYNLTGITNPQLHFYLFNNNVDTPTVLEDGQKLTVDFWDGAAWNIGVFVWDYNQNAAGWQNIIVALNTYTISGPVQFRFVVDKGTGYPFYDDLMLDDICVEEAPACPAPTYPDAATGTVNASLSWTAGTSTTWDLEWGATPYTFTGTPTTGYENLTENPYLLVGLTAATGYTYKVRGHCPGGSTSEWSEEKQFTTQLCGNIDKCTYTVTMTDAYGDGWNGAIVGFRQGGITVATCNLASGSGPETVDVPLCKNYVTEIFAVAAGSYPEEVGFVVTDPWGTVEYTRTPATFATDDIFHTFTPTCIEPTCLAVSGLTACTGLTTADLSWTSNEVAPLGWFVEWGTAGHVRGTGTTVLVTGTPALALTDLTPGGRYDFYVRTYCEVGDTSTWMGPKVFKTHFFDCPTGSVAELETCGTSSNGGCGVDPAVFESITLNETKCGTIWCDGSLRDLDWYEITLSVPTTLTVSGSGDFPMILGIVVGPCPGTGSFDVYATPVAGAVGTISKTYDAGTYYVVTSTQNWAEIVECCNGDRYWVKLEGTTCVDIPTSLNAINIGQTSAQLVWASAAGTLFDLEYWNTSTPLLVTSVADIADTNYTPIDLVGSTSYTFRVRTDCGTEAGAWSTAYTFTTLCAPLPLPWAEGFEGVVTPALPACWLKENGDWATTYNGSSAYDADAHTGTQFLRESWLATNEYVWTPGFALTAGSSYTFSFWWAGDGYAGWTGDIFYNTAQSSTGATQLGTSFVTDPDVTTLTYAQVSNVFIPTTSGTYYFAIRVNCPTSTPWYLSFDDFALVSNNKTLNLTSTFLEGLYIGSQTMNPAMGDGFVPQWGATIADHIIVELHNAGDYSITEDTKTDIELSTSGSATVTIDGSFGASYWITVKHRNSIETVSYEARDFSAGTINFDFSVKAQAYMENMGEFIDAQAAIYAGDVNQDGIIDGSDLNDIGNQNDVFATGYLDEDVNGDGLVDGSDLNICGNNNDAFVAKITP